MSYAVSDIHRDISARSVVQIFMCCNKMCHITSPIDAFPANMEPAMHASADVIFRDHAGVDRVLIPRLNGVRCLH